MLHEFLCLHHDELVARCTAKVARRVARDGGPSVAGNGVPLFLRQLADLLAHERATPVRQHSDIESAPLSSDVGHAAASHGLEMLRRGFSVGQVVHSYGDVCQSVTEMAIEEKAAISADEFRTLNRCLDDAIADAVGAFSQARQTLVDNESKSVQDRLALFVDEQQRLVAIAIQSYAAIKTGTIGLSGATGTLLVFALNEMLSLAERTLPGIRKADVGSLSTDGVDAPR
jgi:hypothetical protein